MPSHTELERKRKRIRDAAEALERKRAAESPSKPSTLNRQDAFDLARSRAKKAGLPPPTTDAFGRINPVPEEVEQQRAGQIEREAVGREFLQERDFLEGDRVRPERVELDIEREGIERIPVIGPGIKALGSFAGKNSILGIAVKKEMFGLKKNEEFQTLIQNPESARELALQKIQEDVINELTTGSEKFGAVIESIPVVGGSVAKYAGALIESPRENVDTLVSEINKIGQIATNTREKVLTGKAGDPFNVFVRLEEYEEDMARMEQRIKILSIESAELTADADALNNIESAILDAKLRIFDAKESAAAGIIAPASDANVFLTLKELGS